MQISQLWDLIETCSFREDLPLEPPHSANFPSTPPTPLNPPPSPPPFPPFLLKSVYQFLAQTPLKINFLAILSIERQVYMQKYNFFVKQIFFWNEVEIFTFLGALGAL